jgi:GAF domain
LSARGKTRTPEAPADLRAEREQFVRNFLHKGVELTEDLIAENQTLDQQVRSLQDENVRLRAQLASNDAIRELLVTIEGLERERKSLLNRSDELERQFQQHSERQNEVEQELNNLASLYVASFQLSGTLSVGRVVRHMCELLEQLVGAQSFVLYIVSPDGRRGVPVGARGQGSTPAQQLPQISVEEGVIGDVCLTGVARVLDPEAARGPNEPIAVLPLIFDAEVVGIITIMRLLPHKNAWVQVDQELFKLLAAHGATALIAANLYAKEVGPRAALHDVLFHLESERVRLLTEAEAETGGDV